MLQRWVSRGGLAAQTKDSEWLGTAAYFSDAAVRSADATSAEHIYGLLEPYEDLFAVDGIGARFLGSVAHHLGTLAALLGRRDAAGSHFEKAIAGHAATGAVLWGARSKLGYARLLHDAGDPRAASFARDALAAFTASGLEAEAAEAAALTDGAPPAPAPSLGNNFRREGEFWTVSFDGSTAHLKDSKGLGDIAVLMARPGREIAALDLIGRDAGPGARARPGVLPESHAGEILDDQARAAYKARIAELQSEIDADPAGSTRAREELDSLTEQLASAYGLGGRARRAGDPAERARKAVTERIRDALAKMKQEHPALHRHLKASIRTGAFCSYSPERPMTWTF